MADGARVKMAQSVCGMCRGSDGHHYPNCPELRTPEDFARIEASVGSIVGPPSASVSIETLVRVARICHSVNVAYARAHCSEFKQSWEEVSPETRKSAIDGVRHALDNPNVTPADMHRAWLESKVSRGWTYGAVIDEHRKEHPCVQPYNMLPMEQRAKDELFLAVVRGYFGA